MAGRIGQLVAYAGDGVIANGERNQNISTELDSLGSATPVFPNFYGSEVLQGGLGRRSPAGLRRGLAAQRIESFKDDFYNRVHVYPSAVAFGSLVGAAEKQFTVWNAYLTNSELTDVVGPDNVGVTVTPPAGVVFPYSMSPLREVKFTATAEIAGPPSFDDVILVTADGIETRVSVSGKRLVVFPFPPNWSNPVDETIEFNSWVLTAANGYEQTGSIWGNQPRRQFDYTITLRESHMQRFENMLFGWQHRSFGLPVWTDKTRLSSAVSEGALVVPCDTSLRSFEPDGLAVIFASPDSFEAFQVGEVAAGSLTAKLPLAKAWPEGTRVYPVIPAQMSDNVAGSYQSDNAVVVPVRFECEPDQTPGNTGDGAAAAITYQGEELYLVRANWSSALSFSYASERDRVDYRTGKFATYSVQEFGKHTRKHTWNLGSREESHAFREWLGRREGVAVPVYMPSGNTDFRLVDNITTGSNAIDVGGNDYDLFGAAHPARRDIIILLRDGTYFVRRITGYSTVDGILRLALDESINQNVSIAEVKRVSLLGFYRLAQNSTTIRWLNDEVGTVEANLVTKRTP